MSLTLSPAAPWTVGQILTASDGTEYEASGPNLAKPRCEVRTFTGPRGGAGGQGPTGPTGAPGENGAPGCDASINCNLSSDTRALVFNTTDKAGTDGPCLIDLDECCEEPPPPMPAVAIMKDCSPAGPHEAGDVVTYSFEVCNTGDEILNNAVVTDSVFGSIGSIATLAVGACQTLTYQHTVTAADVAAGSIDNTASVTAEGAESGETVDSADDHSAPTITTDEPCIELVKSCDPAGPYQIGDIVQFVFDVTNCGNVALNNVTVQDPDATNIAVIGTLAAGATAQVTGQHVVTLAEALSGTFTNTATVVGAPPSGPTVSDTDDHTITLEVNPSIELEKSCDPDNSPYSLGDTVKYLLEVTNTGDIPLNNVVLTDNGADAFSPSGSQNAGTLAVGATYTTCAVRTVTQDDIDAGGFTNTATVNAEGADGTPVNASADHMYTTEAPVECVERELCGKCNVPICVINSSNLTPTAVSNNQSPPFGDGPAFAEWECGTTGVTIRLDYGGDRAGGQLLPQGAMLLFGFANANPPATDDSFTYTLSGINALAFDDCPACVEVDYYLESLAAQVQLDFDNAPDVTNSIDVIQNSPTQFVGAFPNSDGFLYWTETHQADGQTFEVDGSLTSGPYFSGLGVGIQGMRVYKPVKVIEESCDGGDTWEFISATDSDGNTYSEGEITY